MTYSLDIRPLPFGFGWSRGRDPGVYRLWRGEEIVANAEITSRPQFRGGLSLTFNPGDDTVLALHTLLGSAYLSVEACPIKDWRNGRRLSAEFYYDRDGWLPDVIVSTSLWMDPNRGSSNEPRWRRSYIRLLDQLLGQAELSKREITRREVEIPLPEGPCPALVVLEEMTFQRTRWPWAATFRRAEITPHKPPAIPGKGENSWDCDDDALHSMCCPARTIEAAVGHFVESVLHDRQRRAGTWVYPEPKQATPAAVGG